MQNLPKYLSDAGLTHTSASQLEKPIDIRMYEYLFLGPERRNIPVGIPAVAGTVVHEAVQNYICHGHNVDDLICIAQDKVQQHIPVDEIDTLKTEQYLHDVELMIGVGKRAADEVLCDLGYFQEHPISINNEHLDMPIIGYIDLMSEDSVVEIKTKWNRLNPPRKNGSRGFGQVKLPYTPELSHIRQVSVYNKATGKPPVLLYLTTEDYRVFDQNNCDMLTPKALEHYFQQMLHSAVVWQNLLKISTDPNVLKLYIQPDWDNFRWRFMPKQFLQQAKDLYRL